MYSVWVNTFAIVVGGLIGTLLRGGIPVRLRETINVGVALCVLMIGISGAIKTENMMLVIICVVAGGALGEAIRIEAGLERLGEWAQRRFARGDNTFAQGFVSATLLFCVGAMAVVGSLEAGLTGKGDTLMAKSMLDGVTAIIFASSMGPGVILSALPILVYQGSIALLSGSVGGYLSSEVINEMSAVGSVMIVGLGLNMLGVMKERIRVGNMLPAMLLPIAYFPIYGWIAGLFN